VSLTLIDVKVAVWGIAAGLLVALLVSVVPRLRNALRTS
jgi:hypothetical protein